MVYHKKQKGLDTLDIELQVKWTSSAEEKHLTEGNRSAGGEKILLAEIARKEHCYCLGAQKNVLSESCK